MPSPPTLAILRLAMGLEISGTEVGRMRGKGRGGVPTGLVKLELGVLGLGGYRLSSVALARFDLDPLDLRDLVSRLGMLCFLILMGVAGDADGVSSLHQTSLSPAVRSVDPSTDTATSVTQEEWRGRGKDRGSPVIDSQICKSQREESPSELTTP